MAISGTGIGVVKFTSNGTVTGLKQVAYVRWVGATAAGHTAELKDANGEEWWAGEADGPNFTDVHPIYRQINGLVVTLSSGSVYAYLR